MKNDPMEVLREAVDWYYGKGSKFPDTTDFISALESVLPELEQRSLEQSAIAKLIDAVSHYRLLQNPDPDEEQMLAAALEEARDVIR